MRLFINLKRGTLLKCVYHMPVCPYVIDKRYSFQRTLNNKIKIGEISIVLGEFDNTYILFHKNRICGISKYWDFCFKVL